MCLPCLKCLAVKLLGLLLCLGFAILPKQVEAVVVSQTIGNTTRPPDDPGWDNVAIIRGSTGIYLGNLWVMTADHVGVGTVNFPEKGQFQADADTLVRLKNPRRSGLSSETDIILFQLTEDPGLPPLRISQVSPEVGTEAIVVGHGKDRMEEITYWDSRWEETDPPSRYSGFQTQGSNSLRWGTNLIENDELFGRREFDDDITKVVQTNGDVISLITEFDYREGNSDRTVMADGEFISDFEAQAVVNDSGGPLFVKNNGGWELAGMAVAVEGYPRHPNIIRNAVFGSITYHADLATYRDQIVEVVVPGDFDGDGQLTAADIDLLTLASVEGDYQVQLDLNGDRVVGQADRVIWIEQLKHTYFGDSNLDGEFNSEDFITVFQSAEYEDGVVGNSTWASGDWNGDLEFDTTDFVAALQTGGYDVGPRSEISAASAAAIPEPGCLSLFWGALLTFGCFRRRIV